MEVFTSSSTLSFTAFDEKHDTKHDAVTTRIVSCSADSFSTMSSLVDTKEDEPPASPKSLRFKMTIFFLCLVSIVGSMDSVIVAACLPAIARDLQTTSVQAFWVGTSFLLAQTVTIPIYGTASEVFGRKPCILTAISLFLLGSILCATAKNIEWLISARVVQGIGAGGTIQLVQVITTDITTMRERGLYMALTSLAWALGTIGGIPIGGAIGTYTSWHWIFWINVPVCVVSLAGLAWSLNLQKDDAPFTTKLARIDWLGLAVFTIASTLFLIGLTSGGVSTPWKSAETIAPLALGGVMYLTFILVQHRFSANPMMPLRIFKDRTSISGFLTSFLVGLIIWCVAYYMIVFFLGATEQSLLHASISTLSLCAWIAPGAVVSSILIKRTLRFKYLVVVGWVLLVAGMGANTTMHPDSSGWVIYAPRCIAGVGAGILFPTPLFAVQVKQLAHDLGVATSVQVFFRSLGMAFGVAIGGAIFTNRWDQLVTSELESGLIPTAYHVPGNKAELAFLVIRQFPEAIRSRYQIMYADGLITVWWVMMAFAILGLVVSLLSRNERTDRGLEGNQRFVDQSPRDLEQAVVTVVNEVTPSSS